MNRIHSFVAAAMVLGALTSVSACQQKGGPLKVDRVEPAQGSTGGGDQVHIVGSGFEPGKTQVQVMVGRKKAEQVMIASSNKITILTPPGDRGPVTVKLLFDDGAAFEIPDGFRYVQPQAGEQAREAFFSGKPGAAGGPPAKK